MDKNTYYWLATVVMTVCSIITRGGYMVVGASLPLPESVRRALRYAPIAALIAIIVPDLLPWQAGAGPVFDLKALAALIGVALFLVVRNTLVVIVAGMAALWGLRWLLG